MNKNFVIILFVILIIGILVYKYKKNELFENNITRIIPPENINFGPFYRYDRVNVPNYTDKNFEVLYNYDTSNNSEQYTGNIFTPTNFTDNYTLMIAKFLTGRDKINNWINTVLLENFRDYMYFTLHTNYYIEISGSPTYFEIILNKKDNNELFKINCNKFESNTYNTKITNNISDVPEVKNYTLNSLQYINIIITTVRVKTNNLANPYKLENNINIIFNNNESDYKNFKLPDGLENHFLNNFKDISYNCPDSNVRIKLTSNFNASIYGGILSPLIESKRTRLFNPLVGNGSSTYLLADKNLSVKRAIKQDDYLPLGDYYDNNLVDALLLKRDLNYIIPPIKATRRWYSYSGRRNNMPMATYSINNRSKEVDYITNIKTIEKRNFRFDSIADFIKIGSWGSNTITLDENSPEHILVREDCLEYSTNNPVLVYVDSGSKADDDLAIWTYFNNHETGIGFPGAKLANFVLGYDTNINSQYPNNIHKRKPKESCLVSQSLSTRYPDTANLIKTDIDTFFTQFYEDLISYKNKIKTNQNINSINNPIELVYTSTSQRRIVDTKNIIENSSSAYQNINNYNQQMDQIQNKNNETYSFISDVNKQLNEIRNNEKKLVNDELNMIYNNITSNNGIENIITKNNDTSMMVDSSINQLGKEIYDKVGEYSVQKQNQKIFKVINPQIIIT